MLLKRLYWTGEPLSHQTTEKSSCSEFSLVLTINWRTGISQASENLQILLIIASWRDRLTRKESS